MTPRKSFLPYDIYPVFDAQARYRVFNVNFEQYSVNSGKLCVIFEITVPGHILVFLRAQSNCGVEFFKKNFKMAENLQSRNFFFSVANLESIISTYSIF